MNFFQELFKKCFKHYNHLCYEEIMQEIELNIKEMKDLLNGEVATPPDLAIRLQRAKEELDDLVKKAEYKKGA